MSSSSGNGKTASWLPSMKLPTLSRELTLKSNDRLHNYQSASLIPTQFAIVHLNLTPMQNDGFYTNLFTEEPLQRYDNGIRTASHFSRQFPAGGVDLWPALSA